MALDLEPAVTIPWLVRLRWAYLAAQVVILSAVHVLFGTDFNLVAIGIEVGIMGASNVALMAFGGRRTWARSHVVGAVMLLDTCLITLLLSGSGGSANPFTVLYLVHITLSAIVLEVWWTIVIAAFSLGGFALLFIGADEHAMHHAMFSSHLQAMWAAFAVAAVLISFFVGRVTRAIASQREQIAKLRETNERNERLASVTRLAASAAHELGSPLATIAVAAHEAKLHLAQTQVDAAIVTDLELIALEVERCQTILHRMAARGADAVDEVLTCAELANGIRDELGETAAHRVDLTVQTPTQTVSTPRDQLVQSIVALVKNALEATKERVVVDLATIDPSRVEISVQDRGSGIGEEVLAQIGTPFFTTKGDGRGLGLGVFLARAFCESRGGQLTLESKSGIGTRAVIQLPTGFA